MAEIEDDLWIKPDDWRSYEAYVAGALKERFPGAEIRQDVRLRGRHSRTERQIDILVDAKGLIAVECKCLKRRVDVKLVESYLGMLDDLGVRSGILVTKRGYSKAALERARNDPREIDLQIIHPDRLSEYQHVGVPLIYRGELGVWLAPPPFWVADNELTNEHGGPLVMMYPLGHSLESAMRSADVIYGDILSRSSEAETLADAAMPHERDLLLDEAGTEIEVSALKVSDWNKITRDALLRWADIPSTPRDCELALYVDYGDQVLLLVARSLSRDRVRLEKMLIDVASDSFILHVQSPVNARSP
ncbi:MAG: restriction endonuclease [Alphaproteobacteria bacterium]|nr:MAG: restriction endonuclease [Alphaproteobacteria bacterium]